MPDTRAYKIRYDMGKASPKNPFRAYFNQTALAYHGLKPGTPFLFTKRDNDQQYMAIAWYGEQKLNDQVVMISNAFRDMHGLQLEDRVTIEKLHDTTLPYAQSLKLYQERSEESTTDLDASVQQTGIAIVSDQFKKSPEVATGMSFETGTGVSKRIWRVGDVVPKFSYKAIYITDADTKIEITTESDAKVSMLPSNLVIADEEIGGLTLEVKALQEHLDDYSEESISPLLERALNGGILLSGRRGIGKSFLLKSIAAAGWQRVFFINEDHLMGAASGLKSEVDQALKLEPSLIVLDRLEELASGRKASVLYDVFTRTAGRRVLVIGATANPDELPKSWLSHDMFKYQIGFTVPSSKARAEILKVMGKLPKLAQVDNLDDIALRTYGFVPSDLDLLLVKARRNAKERLRQLRHATKDEEILQNGRERQTSNQELTIVDLQASDWERALKETRPSAMYDIHLETPQVYWTDIGGYSGVKDELKFTIGMQHRYKDFWQSFKLEPTRGVLLYGPPGCSKTMMAKAVATEMGFNFIAIKGAEVLDKYVGESERKIRQIFATARAASPSIVFFDEIDAIGGTRASSENGTHGGLHVLTTMLNEMDGIEARQDVFILAATNLPEVLDPALMRPGRLDRHILIDLPDEEARRAIIHGVSTVQTPLLDWLTEATEGYSGAEVVQVIREAAACMLKELALSGEAAAKVQQRQHFEYALNQVEPRITEAEVRRLRAWGKSVRQ